MAMKNKDVNMEIVSAQTQNGKEGGEFPKEILEFHPTSRRRTERLTGRRKR